MPTDGFRGRKNKRRVYRRGPRMGLARRLLLLVSCGVFVVSAGLLIKYLLMTKQTLQTGEELKQAYAEAQAAPTDAPRATAPPPMVSFSPAPVIKAAATFGARATQIPVTIPPNSVSLTPEPGMDDKFIQLYKKNRDVVGWLKVEAVPEIDFPITKRDNDFYINHDYYGRKSASGTVFMDMSCSLLPKSENTILHGHNMKNGTMFGKLKQLMNFSVFKAKPLVYFDTLYENAVYVPYAVSVVSVDPRSPRFFPLIEAEFQTDDAREAYVSYLRGSSVYSLPIDVLVDDEMLTMATCHGNEEYERLVVACRRLRENETEEDVRQLIERTALERPKR